jgi:glycosyltransferase involved in cell wall biosynthesis
MEGYTVYRVPPAVGMNRYGKYLMMPSAFWSLIRERRRYDVIIVSDVKVLGMLGVIVGKMLGKACLLRAATCGELDGSYAYAFDSSASPAKRQFVRRLARLRNLVLKRADQFLSISSAIKQELLMCGIPDKKIVEFGNGVDTNLYKPVSQIQKHVLRQRLYLPDVFLFIYSGRLAKGKGLETLLRAWEVLGKTCKDVHLLLVGSGQGYALACDEELKRFVSDNGLAASVSFLGRVDNVHEYLQAADCFVFPTENEALGNSLIEAISCGLPCIANGVGGVVDVVTHGVNGILVGGGNEAQILEAMKMVLNDPAYILKFRQAAREKALESFSITRKIELLENTCVALRVSRDGGVASPKNT